MDKDPPYLFGDSSSSSSSPTHEGLIYVAKRHREFLKKIHENPFLKQPAVIRNAIRR